MQAAVLWEAGQPFDVRNDVELRDVDTGEIRVRIAASGICHSDISVASGDHPGQFPIMLGHEGAGEITAVGAGVERVKVGDRVILALIAGCGHCFACVNGNVNLCRTSAGRIGAPAFSVDGQPIAGLAGLGTFAEELVTSEPRAMPVPDDVPLDIASLLGCGVMTGAGAAINTAKVHPGASVVVFGCGGVGISVIQGARICGAAEIVAVDRYPSKLEFAKQMGASHGVSPDELADLSSELTGGYGFDYAFEAIGQPVTMRAAYDAIRSGGTAVIVGVAGPEPALQLSGMEFLREKTLKGSLYGSADVRRDFDRMLRLWRTGRLDLEGMVTRRVALHEIDEAVHSVERGEVIRSVIQFN
jgi:S-(hydroxymethyl)glutathione dehydrogenase/alcohol dehydrogenase